MEIQSQNNDTSKLHKPTQYIHELRQVLEADFASLDEETRKKLMAQYGTSSNIDFEKLSLPQLWSLELSILSNLDKPDLLRRTWIIRQKFRAQLGEEIYKNYTSSLPTSINDDALVQSGENDSGVLKDNIYDILKCDALNIARQLQRLSYYKIRRNESISRKKSFTIWSMAALLIIAFIAYSRIDNASFKFLLLIVYSGMIGSVLSLLQRIEKASNTPATFTDNVLDAEDVARGMSLSYLASLIISGGVFAILVYVMAVSGLFNIADVLPKFDIKDTEYFPIPTGNGYTRILIICFLSGFAERLLPDKLDSLIKKTTNS